MEEGFRVFGRGVRRSRRPTRSQSVTGTVYAEWTTVHPRMRGEGRMTTEADVLVGSRAKGIKRTLFEPKKRVVQNGAASNSLVLSAYVGGNEHVFPRIMALYVSPGSVVADVTYGKGVFWKNIPADRYELRATDIKDGVDCRDLPYEDGEVDCVVLDPPYMHSPGGTAHRSHQPFETYYGNNRSGGQTGSKYHEAVLDLYLDAAREAHRVLRDRGVFIVKCQDQVCSNRQRFTHVEIMEACAKMGFVAEDLFVVVRNNRPGVSRVVRQVHARKNHSYFLVFWKRGATGALWVAPT